MEFQPKYDVTESLYEDERVGLYRAVRAADGMRVLLKVPFGPRDDGQERLEREHLLPARLGTSMVLRPLSLDVHRGRPVLVFEDQGCEPLLHATRGQSLSVSRFLELAIRMTQALEQLHAKGWVHRNIKPQNILIHPRTDELKVSGLELASFLPRQPMTEPSSSAFEGSLAYMSPEQTGRNAQSVDQRTDLYSLGVTLFELRAGRLPFEAEDELGLLHALLARTPPRLAEAAPGTPPILSEIVAKLLAKGPEDRYQSAVGLRRDLERCLAQLTADGGIESFPLAQGDVSERFLIPDKLYGRAAEMRTLSKAFDAVVATGKPALVLISGYSGIGKSALVDQLQQRLVGTGARFYAGNCDRLQRSGPYFPLAQALRQLVLDLLAESEDQIAEWRARVQTALGLNAQLIVEIVPALERLIGKQPAPTVLPLDESERRFHLTFQKFLQVFPTRERPLVLFLDDLQWVDHATLAVLEKVLEDGNISHLLWVGAYRDNEVGRDHPLWMTIDRIRGSACVVEQLTVEALSPEHLLQLVSDALRRPLDDVAPLARLIVEKTAGNPFFVLQFLRSLYQDGLLRFSHPLGGFDWDLAAIRARGFTDNVVELMVERLRKLSEPTRRAVELAACAGMVFEASVLAAVRKQSEEEVHQDLWEALRASVLLRHNGDYHFVHDRVHQAAYSLIAQGQSEEVHLQVGRLMLARASAEQLAERIFDIVSQLNRGARLIVERAEKERVAKLNLMASRRAKAAAAYEAAVDYANAGLVMLGETAWQKAYQLALELHIERAQNAYLSKDFDTSEAVLTNVIEHARSRRDQAAAYDILVQLHTNRGDALRACGLAVEYLQKFGIALPAHPTLDDVSRERDRILDALDDRPIEALADLPRMRDPEIEALMRVLTSASSAALFVDTKRWALFSCQRVRLSLEHGNTGASAHAYSTYAVALNAFFGDLSRAHRFGQVAMSMVNDRGYTEFRAAVYLNAGVFVDYWVEPIENVVSAIRRTYQAGVESGALNYACFAAWALPIARLLRGDPLEEVKRENEAQYEFLVRNRFHKVADAVQAMRCFLQDLMGGGDLNVSAFEEHVTTRSWPLNAFFYFARKLQRCVIFGDFAGAMRAAERAEQLVQTAAGIFPLADYVFYAALAAAQSGATGPLAAHERQLRVWAESCPESFRDRAQLVGAELARLEGRTADAMSLYEEAIETARQAGFVHHEAIGAELAAKFYAARGARSVATYYLRDAYRAYLRWGATAKVEQLERSEPSLASERSINQAFRTGTNEIDLTSIMKASQTISSQLVHDELTRTLVRVVVEQAGAQRGCLVLVRDGRLEIAASAESDHGGVLVDLHKGVPLESSGVVPETILHYVVRAREPVILSDAATDRDRFSLDPYIRGRRPRSILCLPLVRGDEAVGYLYLENSLVSGAFTRDCLIGVQALASQAVISLDNARLYDALRASEAKLADFFEGLPVGVVVVDAEGKLVIANRKATEIVGKGFDLTLSVRDLSKAYRIYVAGTDQLYPVESTPFGKALGGVSSMKDDAEVQLDDRRVPLAIWGTPICAQDGSVRYAVVAFQDISSQRAAEAARTRLEDQLQMAERLDSIGRLAGGMAHDLNNLLMPMLIYSEMAMDALDVNSPTRTQIARINEAAERASELVRQLLAFGRRQVLEPQELELSDELRSLEPMLRRLVREDTKLELHLSSAPSVVRADRSQIQRAIMNLAMNAADAMPHGGSLAIATDNVVFGEEYVAAHAGLAPGPYAVLRVSDTGHGMDAQTLARIFEPFFTTKSQRKGTGLGLPTVYGLVKQHGGHIEVASEPGSGTTVEVFLPRAKGDHVAARSRTSVAHAAPHAHKESVLVVDDDPAVRAILQEVLTRENYQVVGSGDPTEALAMARAMGHRLDLLITDVVMPNMNGRQLYEQLAREFPRLHVLFISGYSDDVVSVHGVLEPGFELIQKPFSIGTLQTKVTEILARTAH